MLKTAGIVFKLKLLSLKHNVPSDLFVVLDTYKEKPKNLGAKPLEGPDGMKAHLNKQINRLYET